MKKYFALLLALAMCLSLLAGCGNTSSGETSNPVGSSIDQSPDTSNGAVQTENSEPVYGGTATLYFMNLMTDYDPSAPDFENYMFWYERLFAPDWTITDDKYSYLDENNLTGQIADSWTWDAESKVFTVTIRDDIYFQTLDSAYDYYGGRNLVADDVKWSYDRLLGIGSGYTEPVFCLQDWKSTLYMLDSVEVTDTYTVAFQFNTDSDVAVSDFMAAAVNIAGHEWDELSDEQKADWHYACGTGPYLISDYVEGSNMTLVKNENYYDYDERYPENKLPYLDSIVLTKTADTATLLAEFIAGQVDIVGNNEDVFSVSEAAQLRSSMDTSAFAEYHTTITNRAIVLKQTIEPLTHLEVRQALQYAINLEEIAKEYYGMDDWSVPGMFSSATPFDFTGQWAQELYDSYITYDPELAKQMLEEAGYGDGFTITMAYVDDGDTDLYLLVQQYLAEVGVNLELTTAASQPELQATVTGDNQTTGLANMGNVRLFTTLEFWKSGTANYCLLGDQETLDAMVNAAENATSGDEQKANIKALDEYLAEQHYALYITPSMVTSYFTSSKISGYSGENLYNSWNAGFLMSRVWSSTGK